jgi:conjugal transfer mating pair stabilization protein TraG
MSGYAGVTDDIGILAGYLIASVPFLAAGIAKGALAISSQATSYLAPSQSASEEAAREASTGNIAVGNSSFDTQAFNMKQGNLWTTAGSYTSGVSSFTSVQGDGTRSTQYPESAVVDATGAMSRLPITPQLSQRVAVELYQECKRDPQPRRDPVEQRVLVILVGQHPGGGFPSHAERWQWPRNLIWRR